MPRPSFRIACALMTAAGAALIGGGALADTVRSVPLSADVSPYVYRITSSGPDEYRVITRAGFVNAAGAARTIRPLCEAQGKTPVGHRPSQVVIGNRGVDAVAALSWRVHCQ